MFAEQDSQSPLLEAVDYRRQLPEPVGVELPRRFVEDQQRRLQHQLGSDQQAVFLSHRQPLGRMVEGKFQSHRGECIPHPLRHLPRLQAETFQAEGDLGAEGLGQKLGFRVLQHQTDRGTGRPRGGGEQEATPFPPRRQQAFQRQGQGGLAGAAGAGENVAFPLRELQAELPQGPVPGAGPGVGEVLQAQGRAFFCFPAQKRTSAPP